MGAAADTGHVAMRGLFKRFVSGARLDAEKELSFFDEGKTVSQGKATGCKPMMEIKPNERKSTKMCVARA